MIPRQMRIEIKDKPLSYSAINSTIDRENHLGKNI